MTDSRADLPAESRGDLLRGELKAFIEECRRESGYSRWYLRAWTIVDTATGLPAALLAGISGVTGLASTTGRVLAAILALAAAAFAAASSFLRARERMQHHQRRCRAWQALEGDSRFAYASCATGADEPLAKALGDLVLRRRALMNDDYDTVYGKVEQVASP
ncbi:MAG: hypothetical protein ABW215_04185 [Kibdelosporangium sp.]